jgi:ABC-type multidrug transport system permease subunit
MSLEKVLSSLCYFSTFFAPFIFPIIIYFVVKDTLTKYHAKRALLSHLIPLLSFILIGGALAISAWLNHSIETSGVIVAICFVVSGILNLIVLIWNIVQGIKVLTNE